MRLHAATGRRLMSGVNIPLEAEKFVPPRDLADLDRDAEVRKICWLAWKMHCQSLSLGNVVTYAET